MRLPARLRWPAHVPVEGLFDALDVRGFGREALPSSVLDSSDDHLLLSAPVCPAPPSPPLSATITATTKTLLSPHYAGA